MESFHSFRGFTLVELLVVLGIVGVLSSVVVSSQSNFNKSLLLSSTAYDLALTLRSVQTYGLGSRVVGATLGSQNTGHGIQFLASNPSSFTQFADVYPSAPASAAPDVQPGNRIFDSATELVTTHTFQNGVTIKNFCAYSSGWACAYPSGSVLTGTLTALDIVFSRPNPDPFIRINGNASLSATEACVIITSPQGGDRFMQVTSSGQIHTNATTCP